ncbi:lytic transglycosylase domain-containing protein [Luethyella okanaganae]|uniref:Lytic transglycosylase domain-containing protein n=1 Tax=Luethyella okanaganae TaxID=69372 RepID=A0ABW1VJH7_9MICO
MNPGRLIVPLSLIAAAGCVLAVAAAAEAPPSQSWSVPLDRAPTVASAEVAGPGSAASASASADGSAAPGSAAGSAAAAGNAERVDPTWAQRVALRTGIPARALQGYAGASLTLSVEAPGCHLGWNTIAAIGDIESAHGSHGGAIDASGVTVPALLGPRLDGVEFDAVPDSDGGVFDGDAQWDRAMGPLQFIPSTWQRWGADGDGDGIANPQQIDDAALAAGRFLCAAGDLSTVEGWRAAVLSYNHVERYVNQVAETANRYAGLDG